MQASFDVVHLTGGAINSPKFWGVLLTGFITVYQGYQWIRAIRTKDLAEVKKGLNEMSIKLDDGFEKLTKKLEDKFDSQIRSTEFQTSSLVRELQEMRSDFRTFYTMPSPQMVPQLPHLMPHLVAQMAPMTAARSRKPAARKKSKVEKSGVEKVEKAETSTPE